MTVLSLIIIRWHLCTLLIIIFQVLSIDLNVFISSHLFITLHKTEKSAKLNPLIITPHIRFFKTLFTCWLFK